MDTMSDIKDFVCINHDLNNRNFMSIHTQNYSTLTVVILMQPSITYTYAIQQKHQVTNASGCWEYTGFEKKPQMEESKGLSYRPKQPLML